MSGENRIKLEIGKKYRLDFWNEERWIKVVYVGKSLIVCLDNNDEELTFSWDYDWIKVPEKKEVELYCSVAFLEEVKRITETKDYCKLCNMNNHLDASELSSVGINKKIKISWEE